MKEYVKGFVNHGEYIDGRRIDYRTSHPTKVSGVSQQISYAAIAVVSAALLTGHDTADEKASSNFRSTSQSGELV